MGIGMPAMSLYLTLRKQGHLINGQGVIELGSQQLSSNYYQQNYARRTLQEINVDVPDANKTITAESFYKALGYTTYKTIDADGNNDSLVFDLNHDLKTEYNFSEEFDLVTNHGTPEHVFD